MWFQCSSASRKFLNVALMMHYPKRDVVSVLFSEPKIPQSTMRYSLQRCLHCFSALQRAENSSIPHPPSALRTKCGFSALQRAENSSMVTECRWCARALRFQCSSASRKFLNRDIVCDDEKIQAFQCSSASRKFLNADAYTTVSVKLTEFQCSSASRKFLNSTTQIECGCRSNVSVLFSEPKIPQ